MQDQDINNPTNEEPFDSAQGRLEELQKKSDEYLNNWKRATADLINYKKEEMERLATLLTYNKAAMIGKFLEILDGFYYATKHVPEDLAKNEWVKGLLQIQTQAAEFLKKEGVEEIKTEGQKFDPNTMEVVEEVDGKETGIVVEELQKGYVMGDKVLRPAKVKVSK